MARFVPANPKATVRFPFKDASVTVTASGLDAKDDELANAARQIAGLVEQASAAPAPAAPAAAPATPSASDSTPDAKESN